MSEAESNSEQPSGPASAPAAPDPKTSQGASAAPQSQPNEPQAAGSPPSEAGEPEGLAANDPRAQAARGAPQRGSDLISQNAPSSRQGAAPDGRGADGRRRHPAAKPDSGRQDQHEKDPKAKGQANDPASAGSPEAAKDGSAAPPAKADRRNKRGAAKNPQNAPNHPASSRSHGSAGNRHGGRASIPPAEAPEDEPESENPAGEADPERDQQRQRPERPRKAVQKKKDKKDQKDSDQDDGKGKGHAAGKVLLGAGCASLLLPPAMILMLLMVFMGDPFNQTNTEPAKKSDAQVAKYVPTGWEDVLKKAADTTSSHPEYATVPWTVLAGLVQVQTDFARYSPYDSIDRDPGRPNPVIGGGGGGGGSGTTTPIGNTVGAGPGPVGGITGPGNSTSLSPGHPAPPAGNLSQQLGWYLWALREEESSNNYKAGSPAGSDACGAYQYITSTWNNYGGYPRECDAPPSVQDRREIEDTLRQWNHFHNWQQIIADHLYPLWAGDTSNWNRCPLDLCNINPTVWQYVDGVISKMQNAAQQYPPTRTAVYIHPISGDGTGPVRPGTFAGGCPLNDPSPKIGGEGSQGVGPYLLTPEAASEATSMGYDPNSPCDSSRYVAKKLAEAAEKVYADHSSPKWVPNGTDKDMEAARKYWSKVIDLAHSATGGIFKDRSTNPDQPCSLPPADQKKPWSVSFKIIYLWRCEINRIKDLYLVTGGAYDAKGQFNYTVEQSRAALAQTLVNEALEVSYGGSQWKTGKKDCDNSKDTAQGIFPMTKAEAAKAKVTDRCDQEKNIDGTAQLILSTEQTKPENRPKDLGVFQPMIGGWQNLGIALGTDLKVFAVTGPGKEFTATPACEGVMRKFLTAIAPYATDFAKLQNPPGQHTLDTWTATLGNLELANKLSDPAYDQACVIGSWAPGFNATLAQLAESLSGSGTYHDNLSGLGNYYLAMEDAVQPADPIIGQDSLVIPRLAPRPLNEIAAPVEPDATDAWSKLGSTSGLEVPLDQLAIEYAWFFGGVIDPFNSAGKLIGSLASSSGGSPGGAGGPVQVTVGPDGCPNNAPPNTLRAGADKIGVRQLCMDSVAKAPTPQAAMAIKWALTHLGWPYSQDRRNDNGYADCSSFVSRAYRDSGAIPNLYTGNAPTTDTFRAVKWMQQISLDQAQPGDLVEPYSGHVAMQLADGYKVHTNMTGDVSKVERAYTYAYWVGRVVPSAV